MVVGSYLQNVEVMDLMLLIAVMLVNYNLVTVVEMLALMLVGMLDLMIARMWDLMLEDLQYH